MINTHFEFRDCLIDPVTLGPINNVGETLKLRREALNLSQRELANLSGVSRTCIRNTEEHITESPRSRNIMAIEEALVIEENRRVVFLRRLGYI